MGGTGRCRGTDDGICVQDGEDVGWSNLRGCH